MSKLSRDDFAKRCGVTKMAISKAVRAGKVTEDDKGRVDTADALNRAYLKSDHAVMKRAKKKGKQAPGGRGALSKKRAELWEQKARAEIRLKEEQSDYHVQRRARELGLLVEKAAVERMVSALGQELKLRILGLPRQVAAELFALAHAQGGTSMALEGRLLELLSDALQKSKERARAVGLGSFGS